METNDYLSAELDYADMLVRAAAIEWSERRDRGDQQDSFGNFPFTTRSLAEYCDEHLRAPGAGTEFCRASMAVVHEAAELRSNVLEGNQSKEGRHVFSLGARMGMRNTEVDALLLALLPEVDVRYAGLFSILQYGSDLTRPTLALIFQMLRVVHQSHSKNSRDPLPGERFTFESVCGKWARRTGRVPESDLREMVEVDESIVHYLLGHGGGHAAGLPSFIEGPLEPESMDDLIVSSSVRTQLENIAAHDSGDFCVQAVAFRGPYGSGRLKAALALGHPVFVVDTSRALSAPTPWADVIALCYRLARCYCARIFWSEMDALIEAGQDRGGFLEELLEGARRQAEDRCYPLVSYFSGVLGFEARHHYRRGAFVRLAMPMPGGEVRQEIWENVLPQAGEFVDLENRRAFVRMLAQTFQLTEGQCRDALAAARSLALREGSFQSGSLKLRKSDVEAGCRAQSGRILHQLAVHLAPGTCGVKDIILPPASKAQLENLQYRISNRKRVFSLYGFEKRHPQSTGLLALFTGGSGTGKTLASQIIASENKVDLYKVDMAQLVSKWVGETEKNLARIFAEAADSNAILFFDEADALFGKRGEVKDAQDRWANQEVNFLLQKIEEFDGVVIMATNLRQNIEPAFMRRIHVVIDFPSPDASMRFRIWRQHLGEEISDVEDDELREVAENFALSGGNIRNAVFEAAFIAQSELEAWRLADSEGGSSGAGGEDVGAEEELPAMIRLQDIVRGVGREYFKLGKPVTRGEFGIRFYDDVVSDLFRTEPESDELLAPRS